MTNLDCDIVTTVFIAIFIGRYSVWALKKLNSHIITLRGCNIRDVIERYVYETIYLPNRSTMSISTGWLYYYYHQIIPKRKRSTTSTDEIPQTIITRSKTFNCEICMFRLGCQDCDKDRFSYGCTCLPPTLDDKNDIGICKQCICTDLMNQIAVNKVSVPMCMYRKCRMDDRYVRKRINKIYVTLKRKSMIQLLDRNQIEDAIKPASVIGNSHHNNQISSSERFWRCPTPNCLFAAFVPDATHYKIPAKSYSISSLLSSAANYMSRIIKWDNTPSSSTFQHRSDPRKVTCPVCNICSCQLCLQIWSLGIAQHDRADCIEHERAITQMFGATASNDNDKLATNAQAQAIYGLHQWKQRNIKNNLVRECPSCHILIEKNAGCKHMTCRSCKYEFCWICNQKWCVGHLSTNCASTKK